MNINLDLSVLNRLHKILIQIETNSIENPGNPVKSNNLSIYSYRSNTLLGTFTNDC